MNWLTRLIPSIGKEGDGAKPKKSKVPDGLWNNCPACEAILYQPELEKSLFVCPKCDHHLRIGAKTRLGIFLDNGHFEEFGSELEAKNIDGLIIVDLPGEISHKDLGINNDQLHSITLMSPTTNAIRKKAICRNASGFIYYINVRGVTGHSTLNFKEMSNNIKEIKKSSNLPVFSGFGIKTKEDALKASARADGVVIGSHLVQMIEACSNQNNYKKIYNYLRAIAKAIK